MISSEILGELLARLVLTHSPSKKKGKASKQKSNFTCFMYSSVQEESPA